MLSRLLSVDKRFEHFEYSEHTLDLLNTLDLFSIFAYSKHFRYSQHFEYLEHFGSLRKRNREEYHQHSAASLEAARFLRMTESDSKVSVLKFPSNSIIQHTN